METELNLFQFSSLNIIDNERVSFGTLFPNWVELMDVSEVCVMQRVSSEGINMHLSGNLPLLTFSGFLLGLHCFVTSREGNVPNI